jgi:hypothetical protein
LSYVIRFGAITGQANVNANTDHRTVARSATFLPQEVPAAYGVRAAPTEDSVPYIFANPQLLLFWMPTAKCFDSHF